MTQSRTTRSPYSATWAAVALGVISAATVFAAARVSTAPAPADSTTPAVTTSADPQAAGFWLFP